MEPPILIKVNDQFYNSIFEMSIASLDQYTSLNYM